MIGGYLVLIGIYIVVSIVLTVIGLFWGNIILFESILLSGLLGLLSNILWAMHPALCLLVGVVVFCLLRWLLHTNVGFWVVGGLMSLLWSILFGLFAYFMTIQDSMWGLIVFVLTFVLTAMLHGRARDRNI